MTYIRRQPWRPRSPWLGNRAGPRRRGFRQDELHPAADALQDGVDVVMSVVGEAAVMDTVLAEAISEPGVQSAVPARVDVSGLLAIGAIAPKHLSLAQQDDAFPGAGWHAFEDRGDEEAVLTRHSA